MAGLQRSAVSFRRQGSSGLIWDDKILAGELNLLKHDSTNKINLTTSSSRIQRSQSAAHRTGRVSPALEPPSPRVSACGFCAAFGNTDKTRRRSPKSRKRVM